MIQAARVLKEKGVPAFFTCIGVPITNADADYFEGLKTEIKLQGVEEQFVFQGSSHHSEIPLWLEKADILVNISDTGSIDKVILEAMAFGVQVLTSNEAFENILLPHSLTSKNPEEIAEKIILLSKNIPETSLRSYVLKNHSISGLIKTIMDTLE